MLDTIVRRAIAVLAMALALTGPGAAQERLQVGITLHPYYSFAVNIVGDRADIVPLIAADANPHGYQPQAEDIKRATELDVLIVNGIGHDEWAFEIIAAAGRSEDLPLIEANGSVALIPISGDRSGLKVSNPHTFVSTTAAIQQIYEIARRLGEFDPPNAEFYRQNSRAYALRIRQLKAELTASFANVDAAGFRAATAHAGYDYLFQELGLQVSAVIEPRHGVNPTAAQLADTVAQIKAADVTVLFAEKYFSDDLAETIGRETGVRLYALSHITGGTYTSEKFEVEMRENLETIASAIAEGTP